jgi:transcriptional regulator with XRE-family HTH domain
MRRGIDERGPIAAWLIRSRARFSEPGATRQWTVDQFLAALKAESGYAPTRTTYARWESGAVRPEPENLQRVVDFYTARGVSGPDEPPQATETGDPVAAALLAQTEAINALVAELRLSRLAQVEETAAVLRAIGVLGAGQVPPGTPGAGAPVAPTGTPR